jgi:UDP-glucose:(heptosyl)LPS alpha-1,3-glucosyltransferase
MKIALAIENFSRHGGGAESYAVELAQTLIQNRWEVHLYGHSWDGTPPEAVFHVIPRLPKCVPPSFRIIDFAIRHRKMIAEVNFDVVLGFGNTITMNVYQSHGGVHYLSSMRKIQAISNPVLRWLKYLAVFAAPKYYARAWIESAPFRHNPRPTIVAISDMVRNDMAAHFGVDRKTIRLVYNGIDLERFGTDQRSGAEQLRQELGFENQVLFLFMAYDFRKKGVRYLIEAAGELKERIGPGRFGVIIVGGHPSPSLTRLVEKLQLHDIVKFYGSTKHPEKFYDACDVFVLPTFYDACSLVVFEAMAAGLPTITTVFNGAAGIINRGVDGIVTNNPRNIGELTSAMEFFLTPENLESASIAARNKAAEYSLQENHRKMMEIFNEVAQECLKRNN